jgi:hypothetical protein
MYSTNTFTLRKGSLSPRALRTLLKTLNGIALRIIKFATVFIWDFKYPVAAKERKIHDNQGGDEDQLCSVLE